jgi:hypothetical protein
MIDEHAGRAGAHEYMNPVMVCPRRGRAHGPIQCDG